MNDFDPLNHRQRIIDTVRGTTNGHVSVEMAANIADQILPYVTTAAPQTTNHLAEIEGMILIGEQSGVPVAQGTAVAARDALAMLSASRAERAALAVILHNLHVPLTGYLADVWNCFCEDREAERARLQKRMDAADLRAKLAETKLQRNRHVLKMYFLERGIVGVVLAAIFGNIHEKRGVFNLMAVVAVVCLITMLVLAS